MPLHFGSLYARLNSPNQPWKNLEDGSEIEPKTVQDAFEKADKKTAVTVTPIDVTKEYKPFETLDTASLIATEENVQQVNDAIQKQEVPSRPASPLRPIPDETQDIPISVSSTTIDVVRNKPLYQFFHILRECLWPPTLGSARVVRYNFEKPDLDKLASLFQPTVA